MFLAGIGSEQSCIDSATDILSNFLVNTAEMAASSTNKIELSCPKKSSQGIGNLKLGKKILNTPSGTIKIVSL